MSSTMPYHEERPTHSSRLNRTNGEFGNDSFTIIRLLGNDGTTQPPGAVVSGTSHPFQEPLTSSMMGGVAYAHATSSYTNSSRTLTSDEPTVEVDASSIVSPQTHLYSSSNLARRSYIEYYTTTDYNTLLRPMTERGVSANIFLQPLTEQAISALEEDFRGTSPHGNIGEWIQTRPQFQPSNLIGASSMAPSCRLPTQPMVRTGSITPSSWTAARSTALPAPSRNHTAEDICAVGQQFDDISACPNRYRMLDEDCE